MSGSNCNTSLHPQGLYSITNNCRIIFVLLALHTSDLWFIVLSVKLNNNLKDISLTIVQHEFTFYYSVNWVFPNAVFICCTIAVVCFCFVVKKKNMYKKGHKSQIYTKDISNYSSKAATKVIKHKSGNSIPSLAHKLVSALSHGDHWLCSPSEIEGGLGIGRSEKLKTSWQHTTQPSQALKVL